jgi:hypothetical protein
LDNKAGEKLVNSEDIKKRVKDDWAYIDEFLDNTFWKLPEQYKIDDLMNEMSKAVEEDKQ